MGKMTWSTKSSVNLSCKYDSNEAKTTSRSITLSGGMIPRGSKNIKIKLTYKTSQKKVKVTATCPTPKAQKKSVTVTFTGKYNGKLPAKVNDQVVSKVIGCNITSISATVTFTSGTQTSSAKKKKQKDKAQQRPNCKETPGLFPHKAQAAYIIDTVQTSKKKKITNILRFDGVIKASVNSQVKMQEDPSNQKGYSYINNALDQPDEITLQILESQVYTNASNFEGSGRQTRVKSTFAYLYQLKKYRRKVTIVIPAFGKFPQMVLKTMTANLDEKTTNGWSGQLTFRQYMIITKNKKKGKGSNITSDRPTPSVFYQMFGRII